MGLNSKQLLFERINHLDSSFKFPLNEVIDRNFYLTKLNEKVILNNSFSELSKVFSDFNKLSGNLNEDRRFLTEFILLCEEEEEFDPFAHLKGNDKIDEKEDCVLTFSLNNEKLDHPYLSLPAGYTCPFADICKTKVLRDREKDQETGKLTQDLGDIRCYAASEEARYPNAQESRWTNYDLLQQFNKQGKVDLILRSLKYFEKINGSIDLFRIHESGDFYNIQYFDAWIEVARERPDIVFYAYTKSLPFWVKRINELPNNLKLVASVGGTHDYLITKHNLKYAVIVNSPEEAAALKLPIDIDDTFAHNKEGNFALLIHGSQPAGTEASKNSLKNRKIVKDIKNKYK